MDIALQRSVLVPSLFDLSGKTAVVVGGYGAIGRMISEALAGFGAATIVAGRHASKAEQAADELRAKGFEARAESFDATDLSQIDACLDRVVSDYGGIDVLINCLGHQQEQRILDVSEEAFDNVYSINLKAAMFLAQRVARVQCPAGRGGSQIHLLSLRSQFGLIGRGYASFCAAKGGLAALVKQHAAELGEFGIRVNGIAPGVVHTFKNDDVLQDPEQRAKITNQIPLGRVAKPEDVAGAALFLCSPAASFVTGHILTVDGGLSCCR